MQVLLLTGRTVDQGCSKESGKLSKQYAESVAVCEMNPEDMKNLRINDGQKVQVSTECGSVIVKAIESRRIKTSGTAFIPYGPWANTILSSNTDSTGMPSFKGVEATVEPTDDEFLGLPELLQKTFGKAKT